MSSTRDLAAAGQSIWIDNITRDLLDNGGIQRYIDEFNVTGLTSNPSIFEKAVAGSSAYDSQIRECAAQGRHGEDLFFELALADLRRAASLFAPLHERTEGRDGFVSLEVSPLLADDTAGTVAAARALFDAAGAENLYIKIPGTPAGLPAITEAIAAGIPVNVTLLFSPAQYVAAAEAYLRGLELREAAGLSLDVSSVASLFISRWDVATAAHLPEDLKNTVGLAIGAAAYGEYRCLLASERVQALEAKGAHLQRLLFASTGVKDPAVRDTLYVERLAAPDTVNTVPDSTLLAFADHGVIDGVLPETVPGALATLGACGDVLDLDALAQKLQDDGKEAFVASWHSLLASVEEKTNAVS